MATNKFNSLGNSDIKKYKNMMNLAEDFITQGKDKYFSSDNKYDELTPIIFNDKIKMIVSKIVDIAPDYKLITIRNERESKIALFNPGQYISVTIVLDGRIMTRIYTIVSGIKEAKLYEYSFIVKNDNNGKMSDFLYNNLKIDDDLIVSGPYGDFYYNELVDKRNIIGLSSPEGILPFISMAKAISDGDLNVNLKIFYSAKKYEDLILVDYLKGIVDNSEKIDLYILLSEEEKKGTIKGVITYDEINKIFDHDCSIFVSGEEGFLKYLNKELDKLKIPRKFIRCNMYKPKCNIKKVKAYLMTVHVGDEVFEFPCFNNKTLLESIEENNLYVPNRCHIGICGLCKTKLLNGKIKVINDRRNVNDIENNLICPCSTYPLSDIEIRIR